MRTLLLRRPCAPCAASSVPRASTPGPALSPRARAIPRQGALAHARAGSGSAHHRLAAHRAHGPGPVFDGIYIDRRPQQCETLRFWRLLVRVSVCCDVPKEKLWDETSTLRNGLLGRSAADRARRLHHTLASVYQAGADAGRYLRAHVWPWGRSQSPNPHALLPWGQMVLGVVVIRVLRVEEEVIVLACACMA